MATLNTLKKCLRKDMYTLQATSSATRRPLSDEEYIAGFQRFFRQGRGSITYENFIAPQISECLDRLVAAQPRGVISVLEIGPGPESVLGLLPEQKRRRITRYNAFEPNETLASRLETWLAGGSGCKSNDRGFTDPPFPALADSPKVHRRRFRVCGDSEDGGSIDAIGSAIYAAKYDLVLFCHSMYGMKPRSAFVMRALDMLVDHQAAAGMVVVFHRQGVEFDGLVCHQMASFPTGTVSISNTEEALNLFSPFIAGCFLVPDGKSKLSMERQRAICHSLGRPEGDALVFHSPEIMLIFTRQATGLLELTSRVPQASTRRLVKNRQARLHNPPAVIRPTEISHVQDFVRWAIRHKTGLTIIGGSHSDHCVVPSTVAIDMSAFDQVDISDSDHGQLVIVGAGVKTGDIIRKAMGVGLAVPLGSRPSVGAGLWLQGGIGHLTRPCGLACDAIVGAILVGVHSGQTLHVGHVPTQYRPTGSIRPENESDILWAMKGAGTNFGVVVTAVLKSYPAPNYVVRSWTLPLDGITEAEVKLKEFDLLIARKLPRSCSSDAYLYWDADRLHLGVTMYQAVSSVVPESSPPAMPLPLAADEILGSPASIRVVDGIGLFETELYMSGMHGGHGGGKTSSFKRCVFLEDIGSADIVKALVHALENRPSPLCYFHLLHGGGAVADVAPNATAFGCRGWNFACVVTGVWPRRQQGQDTPGDQNDDEDMDLGISGRVQQWVYNVVDRLLAVSTSLGLESGVYPADLGPDPRDAPLAATCFGKGPNRSRLVRLKQRMDPHNVLAYACPLPRQALEPNLIVLVTGEHGAGKDYCAEIWASVFSPPADSGSSTHPTKARTASISDVTKREYAAAVGADLNRLLLDRDYKEAHRPALTSFFQEQVRKRPRLPEEHFLDVVYQAANDDVEVLFVTGMRDEAPVAMFSHLVPDSRVIEVCVKRTNAGPEKEELAVRKTRSETWTLSDTKAAGVSVFRNHVPDLIFYNDLRNPGCHPVKSFGERNLLPLVYDKRLHRLKSMIRLVADFPHQGIDFRHVLGITQKPGGLKLVTSLFSENLVHFTTTHGIHANNNNASGKIDAIVTCETGGFLFASPLAMMVDTPLVLVRKSGRKLPPPTCSVGKEPSHISQAVRSEHSLHGGGGQEKEEEEIFEMEKDAIPEIANCRPCVLVIDDVLATGKTLCAILRLLREVGIEGGSVGVMVVAEFPLHRGRRLLLDEGFGEVKVKSLLTFGGL